MGGPENGNFPLLYVMKMSLRRWVGGSKKPLRNIKMAPNHVFSTENNQKLAFSDPPSPLQVLTQYMNSPLER